jgi:hypothetical protein
MKNYDATVALMDLYGGSNTTYQDGVQSGSFYNPNNASLTFGVKTNDFYMFESCEFPNNITLPLWDFTVASGEAGEYYIPLSSINEDLVRTTFNGPVEFGTSYCMVSSDEIGNDELQISSAVEKILTFSGDKDFKVKVSGFTRNEKKIVYEEEAAEVVGDTFTATMNNGASRISSIQIVATPPFNIKVYIRLIYMLPYTDYGKNNLIISTTSNDLKVGYSFNNSDVLDNLLEYLPASTSQDQITANSGQIRPQVIVNADLYIPENINISRIYALQSLNNNILSSTDSNFLNSNNIDSIYGWEPYSEGWEDWKG